VAARLPARHRDGARAADRAGRGPWPGRPDRTPAARAPVPALLWPTLTRQAALLFPLSSISIQRDRVTPGQIDSID